MSVTQSLLAFGSSSGRAIARACSRRETATSRAFPVVTAGFLLAGPAVAEQPGPSPGRLQEPFAPSQPDGETNRLISKGLEAVGPRYDGALAYYNDGIYGDTIGTFFGFYAQAHALQDGVCAAWRAMPPNGPFTGHASVGGLEVSLDKMGGLQK